MLSINESHNIVSLFDTFEIRNITVQSSSTVGIGRNNRKELIITNY